MTPEFELAEQKDKGAVVELLNGLMDPKTSLETWSRLFEYEWLDQIPNYGMVCYDGEALKGYVGAIYSSAQSHAQHLICNLHSAYIHRDLRSLGLLKQAVAKLRQRDDTYVVLTAAPKLWEAYQRADFQVFETHRYIFPALKTSSSEQPIKDWQNEPRLARLCNDHLRLGCRVIQLQKDSKSAVFILKDFPRKIKGYFSEVIFTDNYDFLLEFPDLVSDILNLDQDSLIAVDRRFLKTAPQGARLEELASPRLFHSRHLKPLDLNALYSEVVLLNMKM